MKTLKSWLILLLFFVLASEASAYDLVLSEKELQCIADRVYENECAQDPEQLVSWNEREGFPSLGLAHFIWYPENFKGRFHESFPDLVRFLKNKGAVVPDWLWSDGAIRLPWPTREEFIEQKNSPQMLELKEWMKNTMDLQALFIMERLKKFHAHLAANANPYERIAHERFEKLAESPQGIYALMDYLNFKGEGFQRSESYNGYGWGLKQVLEAMDPLATDKDPIAEFSSAASRILERRVQNSDPTDQEVLWLPGWNNRTLSYLEWKC